MKLDKYISDLLYRYQCVTIPEFGAFLTEYKSAEIDVVKNIMLPPKKTITFNRHLQNNDGLLANHVATEEKINYADAVANIKQIVVNWNNVLDLGETITLDLIGELFMNSEGNIEFVAFNTLNYNTDAFGLTNIVAPYIGRESDNKGASTTLIAIPSNKNEGVKLNNVEKKVNQPNTLKKSSGNYGSIAAVLTVMIGCGWAYKSYNDKIDEQVALSVQDKVEKTIQQATFTIPNPTKPLFIKVDNSINANANNYSNLLYHVIAGSFKSEENALKKAKELQKLGFTEASIIGKNPYNLYMVAYKSFADYSKAIQELNAIQKNNNQDAWVYTKL